MQKIYFFLIFFLPVLFVDGSSFCHTITDAFLASCKNSCEDQKCSVIVSGTYAPSAVRAAPGVSLLIRGRLMKTNVSGAC